MKKKKIIVILIISLLIVLLTGLISIFFASNVFKSNKSLFMKYIAKNKEYLDFFMDEDLINYGKRQNEDVFSIDGNVSTKVEMDDEDLKNFIQDSSIEFKGISDAKSHYLNQNIIINYNKKQNLQFELIADGDVYGLKLNDVMSKFLGIENNNLKELAKKLGAEESEIAQIPNKIEFTNIDSSNVFTKKEIEKITKKYLKIVIDSFDNNSFSKENLGDYIAYTLSTNSKKIEQVGKKLVNTVLEDKLIMKKIENNMKEKMNLTDEEVNNYIENAKKSLLETEGENDLENDNIKNVLIEVHVKGGKLIKTQIKYSSSDNSIINITITKLDKGVNLEYLIDYKEPIKISASIEKEKNENGIKYIISGKMNDKDFLKCELNFDGINGNQVKESAKINLNLSSMSEIPFYNMLLYSQKKEFIIENSYTIIKNFSKDIEKTNLTEENVVLLNNFETTEDLYDTCKKVLLEFKQLNMCKMVNANISRSSTTPFSYYKNIIIPAFLSASLQTIDNNGENVESSLFEISNIPATFYTKVLSSLEEDTTNTKFSNKNKEFVTYIGNGISGRKANQLLEKVMQFNNSNNEREIKVQYLNPKGKKHTIISKNQNTDGRFSDEMYFYITVETENDFIKNIIIQQGQELNSIDLLKEENKYSKKSIQNKFESIKDIILLEMADIAVEYYRESYHGKEITKDEIKAKLNEKISNLNISDNNFKISIDDGYIIVASKIDPSLYAKAKINYEKFSFEDWEENF